MKTWRVIVGIWMSLLALKATAQNNQEIKRQAEQIAYLKIYGELIKKGYEIAKAGLNLIGDIKNKDFLQHQNYFKSLGRVKNVISKSPQASRAAKLGKQIMIVYHRDWPKLSNSENLSENEKTYAYGVFQRLIQNSHWELEQLEALLTDDKLILKDGERLERIGNVLLQMEDNYEFISRFSSQALMLVEARKRSRQQAGLLDELLNPDQK